MIVLIVSVVTESGVVVVEHSVLVELLQWAVEVMMLPIYRTLPNASMPPLLDR